MTRRGMARVRSRAASARTSGRCVRRSATEQGKPVADDDFLAAAAMLTTRPSRSAAESRAGLARVIDTAARPGSRARDRSSRDGERYADRRPLARAADAAAVRMRRPPLRCRSARTLDGRRRRVRLWAPAAREVARDSATMALPHAAGRRGLLRVHDGSRRRRHASIAIASTATLACPTRRRASTRRRARPERGGRSARIRLERRRLARPAMARGGDLRAARRHVHAARAPSPASSAKLDYLADARRHRDRADAARRLPGQRDWGYDGVLLFAPDARYGTARGPEAPRRRRARARADGVPRRRLQPLRARGQLPARATRRSSSPTATTRRGARRSISTARRRPVREFFIHNALYWLEEYRFDGLRLDAVHAILDDRRPDILTELADARAQRPGARARRSTSCWRTTRNEARYLRAAMTAGRAATPRSGTTTSTTRCTCC